MRELRAGAAPIRVGSFELVVRELQHRMRSQVSVVLGSMTNTDEKTVSNCLRHSRRQSRPCRYFPDNRVRTRAAGFATVDRLARGFSALVLVARHRANLEDTTKIVRSAAQRAGHGCRSG